MGKEIIMRKYLLPILLIGIVSSQDTSILTSNQKKEYNLRKLSVEKQTRETGNVTTNKYGASYDSKTAETITFYEGLEIIGRKQFFKIT